MVITRVCIKLRKKCNHELQKILALLMILCPALPMTAFAATSTVSAPAIRIVSRSADSVAVYTCTYVQNNNLASSKKNLTVGYLTMSVLTPGGEYVAKDEVYKGTTLAAPGKKASR